MQTEFQPPPGFDAHDECAAWFAQALQGDSDEATWLHERFVSRLGAWLCLRGAEEVAKSSAHEAKVRAFRHGDRFRPRAIFMTWTRNIEWRLALKSLRDSQPRQKREVVFKAQYGIHTDIDPAPCCLLLSALRMSADASPAAQRDLVHQRFDLDQSAGEIAASMGRSRVAVAVSLHRICKRLRSGLKQHARL
jgi:DNA-directed RNA polymerase specialized sigma24 family protein